MKQHVFSTFHTITTAKIGVFKFIICILFYNACQRILYSIGTVHLDYQHIIEIWQMVRTSLTICLRDKYQHLMSIFGVVCILLNKSLARILI